MESAIGPALRKIIVPLDAHLRSIQYSDVASLDQLYPAAFPEEDLLPLVRELTFFPELVTSWVVEINDKIIGHIAFTQCSIGTEGEFSLLGPLAVDPVFQKKGLGKKLIEFGVANLRARGVAAVFVLGDPNYYCRSGFAAERLVLPPFLLPDEWNGAWQSLKLDAVAKQVSGKLTVPPVWSKKELCSG